MVFKMQIGAGELAIILILTGLILLIVSIAILMLKSRGGGDFIGVILLGPIPIVFGNASALKRYWWLLALIGLLVLLLYLLPFIMLYFMG